MLYGVLSISLAVLGGFIKVRTKRSFNCRFEMWRRGLSFDGVKLIVVFVIFELEIVVVVIMMDR